MKSAAESQDYVEFRLSAERKTLITTLNYYLSVVSDGFF